ncbi:MAG: DUF4388 domain-containing protein [Chloracidobacterium sp.]|nr:DUF4388 domain-containing protein [Chloracidobacterium sp.]MCC6824563.1 DUF4388 domain-containing protein [Acidobacteriota bacterium]MCO5333695.1 DUF4388 domain-containing protein [Pyrinomonadaceae bacterium]
MSRILPEPSVPVSETSIESVLLDADLFVKYSSPDKAFELLRTAIERSPRSIDLREKMRDVAVREKNLNEAARQCLALVSLYIARDNLDLAYDRLQEAKLLDPRISVAPGLEAIRRARRPDLAVRRDRSANKVRNDVTLAGDLSFVSIFDAVQVVEGAKMTGLLVIKSDLHLANVAFNGGKIVDAECNGTNGAKAFREIVDIAEGTFEFTASEQDFPIVINITSNTNFLLDILTELDQEKAEKQGTRNVADELI